MGHRSAQTLEHGLLLGMALNEAEGAGCFQAYVPAFPRSLDPGRQSREARRWST